MEIYALVGKSGTGKSFKAQAVAGMHGIDYILDDGLLIKGTKVIAGKSAKREKTKFAAVRRAVFLDEEHRNEIINALIEFSPEKILIIGTSQHMIKSIMGILNMDGKYNQINIEDISTSEELELAVRGRKINGKHIIPVPTFEIKKAFSGYFIDSIKQFTRRNEKSEEQYEKSVVRPTFSYLGSYEISDVVLKKIIEESALEIENVSRIVSIDIENKKEGIIIVIITVLNYKNHIPEIVNEMSKKIKSNVEYMTGINVLEINTIIKSLVF
jgi:uncharacterized alkaline shock family protein YloU